MLLSYLKIAWKVLLRRKFFTFISLFGISFTLMVLLVIVAMSDNAQGAHAPESRIKRMAFITFISQRFKDGGQMNTPPSPYFLDKYVRPMKTPEKMTFYSMFHATPSYVGNKKLELDLKFTDNFFWEIFDFNFLEGKPYNANDLRDANRVVVISQTTAREYFGVDKGVVGRTIEVDQTKFRVIGVVSDVPVLRFNSYAEVWAPMTTTKADIRNPALGGEYFAALLAPEGTDLAAIDAEYQQVIKHVANPNPDVKGIYTHADGLLATFTRQLFGQGESESDQTTLFYFIAFGLALLFMSLPALNLVNINLSRIMERSSEIGVRKAFGATSTTLVGQFLIENIFLTLLGALVGLLLAYGALELISGSSFIPYAQLTLNLRVFAWALLAAVFFGVLSGVYPAFKMSRVQPIQALKGGTN
ncbi:ABC transporter permease [Hymenobacter qilianensis]|uniref:ABC transporter permease n=2 Tax=Hymenobacter qilianensis TaxID=1385715 RepID=A0ACB5PTM9_9BACT|nr:ABC transporter permease [Hymenobacter qilianensis]QNP52824.1 ABC transporter permease [Hymenobacter qilianensis]GGF71042.1 ABC transporter permease [Hymenobacter qilianensis]